MFEALQIPYVLTNPAYGEQSKMPYLPLTLATQKHSVSVDGLIDSGAMVNVLPYNLGMQLGLDWAQLTVPLRLTGNLAQTEARGVIVSAQVGHFPPVRLAFAWTRTNDVPLLLGQTNFLQEFDVCFRRSQSLFDIRPKPLH